MILTVNSHGPPQERDNEDIAMGRKVKKVMLLLYSTLFFILYSRRFIINVNFWKEINLITL